MGDVVHAVPVVEDIKRFISDAEIDWLVEDSFADIPRHVAGVSEVIECSVRKWKKRIFEKSTRDQIKALREKLRGKHYDLVIDLQGLIKSAVLASWTNAPVAGYDRRSGKEPLATILYSVKSSVDRQKSAVDRCRELTAKVWATISVQQNLNLTLSLKVLRNLQAAFSFSAIPAARRNFGLKKMD